jgi:hypothetical protein
MPERPDHPTFDDRPQSQTAGDHRDGPNEAECYPFLLDDGE